MRVLFDQATPVPIRAYLDQHEVSTAFQQGWATLKNGDLLTAAEGAGFDVLLTTDKNLRYQQNLAAEKSPSLFLGCSNGPNYAPTFNVLLKRSTPPCWAAMLRSTFRLADSMKAYDHEGLLRTRGLEERGEI
jgi:hypothetical protein